MRQRVHDHMLDESYRSNFSPSKKKRIHICFAFKFRELTEALKPKYAPKVN